VRETPRNQVVEDGRKKKEKEKKEKKRQRKKTIL